MKAIKVRKKEMPDVKGASLNEKMKDDTCMIISAEVNLFCEIDPNFE